MHEPTADEKLVKVKIRLPEGAWHGFAVESLWARQLGPDTVCLMNTPFFARDMSYLDEASITFASGQRVVEQVVKKSGHATYRIIPRKEMDDAAFQTRWHEMQRLGCSYESYVTDGFRLYAVDVPPAADIGSAYHILERGLADGIWDFEEGDYGRR